MDDKELKIFKELELQEEKAEKHNNEIIDEFEKYLISKSLKTKTIGNHINNIEFFANSYLTGYESLPVDKGALSIGRFLGDYFIRKTMWASKAAINENIASFKKFYTFLNEKNLISAKELEEMKALIRDEKEFWISFAGRY